MFLSFLLSFLVLEILFRFYLFLIIGLKYKYLFFPYSLIDHPHYGYSLRPSYLSKSVEHNVFDKFLFEHNSDPLYLSKEDNKKGLRLKFSVNDLGFRGPNFSKKKK